MIIAYLDHSLKNITADEQKEKISEYIKNKQLKIDRFYEHSLEEVFAATKNEKTSLIVANLLALGEDVAEVQETLKRLIVAGVDVQTASENLKIREETGPGAFWAGVELGVRLRNDIISIVTRKTLAQLVKQGVRLGRRPGTKNKTVFLTNRETEIRRKFKRYMSLKKTANALGVCCDTLREYMKEHPEIVPKEYRVLLEKRRARYFLSQKKD